MNNNSIRRIDDLGRVAIPKEIRDNMGLNDGDALEFDYNDGIISIRKCKKSFRKCAVEWYNSHEKLLSYHHFQTGFGYTFCIINPYNANEPKRAGFAKCFEGDIYDPRIGKVAAYARAIGQPINELIGYKGK